MSRAEEFIKAKTRIGSNTTKGWRRNGVSIPSYSLPWLAPDQARRAAEIAREEIYEWLQKISFDDYKVADEESYRMGCPYDYIDVHGLINDLKQAMKDE